MTVAVQLCDISMPHHLQNPTEPRTIFSVTTDLEH